MYPNRIPQSQKGKPWPAYFLVRTTGEVVPLIAVDELPPGTDLAGVPRSLDLQDTIGMLNLGLQRSSASFYQLSSGQEVKVRTENVSTRVDKQTIKLPNSLSSPDRNHPHPPTTTATSTPPSTPKAQSTRPARTHATSMSLPLAPSEGPTELCRHWCHHGICKWGQHCRYRHTIPMTLTGLQEVGLTDWPLWFRRMNPGYFTAENPNLGRGGGDRKGRRGNLNGKVCMSPGGNGGACCGVLHGRGGGRERARVRERIDEKERVGGRGDRGGKVLKSEELGEQIIARLRGMAREHSERVVERTERGTRVERGDRGLSSNALIEMAAARDTKNWEDDEESELAGTENDRGEDEKEQTEAAKIGKGKLVDV